MRKASVAHSALATAATAHTVNSSCTASIAAEQCRLAARRDRSRLQRCREGAPGGGDGGAPGRLVHRAAASLQGTLSPMGTRSAHAASCLLRVARANLLTAAAPDPPFGSTLFLSSFACLFACLFFCLFPCDWPLQNTPSMARPTPHERRRVVMAFSRRAAQECAVRALVRHRQAR